MVVCRRNTVTYFDFFARLAGKLKILARGRVRLAGKIKASARGRVPLAGKSETSARGHVALVDTRGKRYNYT